MKNVKVNYANFLADFNLFLCESFGDRDSARFNHISNGETFYASANDYDLYIRLWEYSGDCSLPDFTVIIVRASYTNNPRDNFENLLRFLKAYSPIYGYNNIAIELPPLSYDYDETEYGFSEKNSSNCEKWQCIPISSLKLP